jgi:periplasmic glucans biosynthesis protein
MKIWTVAGLAALAVVSPVFAEESPIFSYQDVVSRAEQLSKQPFTPQIQQLSGALRKLDYDSYFRIRFLTEHTVWPGLPYRLGFYFPGFIYRKRVLMHAIEPNRLRDIPFSPSYFHYDMPLVFTGHEDFVGFRVYAPSARRALEDEFLSFLGASYFRAVSMGLHWGASARGLAINTGLSTPEEFPDFREFWVRRPQSSDTSLQFFALLDSPSLTGGYQFNARYGHVTTMDIQATVFIRKTPGVLLLAPLTSMFYFGSDTVNKPTFKPDYRVKGRAHFLRREFRPQVHDSDGLLMDTVSGEKLWAPLDNPKSLVVRSFSDVTSYGLLQRDRAMRDYLDQEAEYQLRPSIQVIPKNGFNTGQVRLVEIPTADEYVDNIVAAWEVQNPPDPGGRIEFAYRLVWGGMEPDTDQLRVLSTILRPNPQSKETRFTVQYGKPKKSQPIPVAELRPYIVVSQNGQVKDVQFTSTGRSWLVSFTIVNLAPPGQPLDISCVILRRGNFCSEKWVYLLNT